VATEAILKNRLDAALSGIYNRSGKTQKLVGLMLRCANVGYLVIRKNGQTVLTADLATLNAATFIADLDIDLADGDNLTFGVMSSSGTSAVTVTAFIEQ